MLKIFYIFSIIITLYRTLPPLVDQVLRKLVTLTLFKWQLLFLPPPVIQSTTAWVFCFWCCYKCLEFFTFAKPETTQELHDNTQAHFLTNFGFTFAEMHVFGIVKRHYMLAILFLSELILETSKLYIFVFTNSGSWLFPHLTCLQQLQYLVATKRFF